jgi:hypothetical protein
VCAACLKNSVRIFVEKIYKMGCLEGSGVPVLYIGCTVPKGYTYLCVSEFGWNTEQLFSHTRFAHFNESVQ